MNNTIFFKILILSYCNFNCDDEKLLENNRNFKDYHLSHYELLISLSCQPILKANFDLKTLHLTKKLNKNNF